MGQQQSLQSRFPQASLIMIENSSCEALLGRRFDPVQPMPRGVTDSYKWGEFTRTISELVSKYWTEAYITLLFPVAVLVFIIPNFLLDRSSSIFAIFPILMIVIFFVIISAFSYLRSANMKVDRQIAMTVMRYSQELGVAMAFHTRGVGICQRRGAPSERIILIHPTATFPQGVGGMYPMMAMQQQPYGVPPYGNIPIAPPVQNQMPPAYANAPPPYANSSQLPVAQPLYDTSRPIKSYPTPDPPAGVPNGQRCYELVCPAGYALRAGTQVIVELPDGRKMNITVNKALSSSQTMIFYAPV